MAYCTSCGAQVASDMTFCPACGTTVAAPGTAAPAAAWTTPVAPVKLRTGELLSGAFRMVFGQFPVFLRTQGVFILAAALVSFLLSVFLFREALGPFLDAVAKEDIDAILATLGPLALGAGVSGIVGLVLQVLATAMGIAAADALHGGERVGFGAAWSRIAPRLGNFALTSIIAVAAIFGVVVAGAMLAFLIVPLVLGLALAVYLAARWVVAGAVSILERERAADNLRRSWTLTATNAGAILGALVLLLAAVAIPSAIVGMIFTPDADPAATYEPPTTGALAAQALLNLPFQLIGSFAGAALVVQVYRGLRPREAPAAASIASDQPLPPY